MSESPTGPSQSRKVAVFLTLACVATSFVLLLFILFGPDEGMEALIIILPWMLAVFAHSTLGLAALIFAVRAGTHRRNAWIYLYFLLFFGINGYELALLNDWDEAAARRIDDVTRPEESELHALLRRISILAMSDEEIDPALLQRSRELASEVADANYQRPGTHSPVIVMAAQTGDPVLVSLLLERGARVDGGVEGAQTPLLAAVSHGHIDVVDLLLQQGAAPDEERYEPHTPLMLAARAGDARTARALLEAGANPDATTSSSSAPLFLATSKSAASVVATLLEYGADPNILLYDRITPMFSAVKAGCSECVRLLLAGGGSSAGGGFRGETPLLYAIEHEHEEILELLAHAGTPPGSAQDLVFAADRQDVELLDRLLALGVDPNSRNERGDTLLLYLAQQGRHRRMEPELDAAAARVAIARGAEANLAASNGATPLGRAARAGAAELAQVLIESGADLEAATEDGRTPLLESLWAGHWEIANALVQAGADPNTGVEWGTSRSFPLGEAVKKRHQATVEMLLSAGARPDPQSRDLCDLLDRAADSPDLVRRIVGTGVDLDRKDPLGRYPLSVVVQEGPAESVAIVIEAGAEPWLSDWRGRQPFMRFIENDQADLVRLSLERSRHIRQDRELLKRAMYSAIRKARPEVVRVLLEEGLFYTRLAEVEAILDWAQMPPATAQDKAEILEMFRQRIGDPGPPRHARPLLRVTPRP